MELILKDSHVEIWETESHVFGIVLDNSFKNYYNVSARKKPEKAKTIATRCTYEKAINLINNYKEA